MESDRDTLLLTGELKPGLSRESAASTLSTLFEVPRDQALQWLAGGEQVLRNNLPRSGSGRRSAKPASARACTG